MTPTPKPPPPRTRITEPAADPSAELEDVRRQLTADDAVRVLIDALGFEDSFVKSVSISAAGQIRVSGRDNSTRTVRFSGLERKEAN